MEGHKFVAKCYPHKIKSAKDRIHISSNGLTLSPLRLQHLVEYWDGLQVSVHVVNHWMGLSRHWSNWPPGQSQLTRDLQLALSCYLSYEHCSHQATPCDPRMNPKDDAYFNAISWKLGMYKIHDYHRIENKQKGHSSWNLWSLCLQYMSHPASSLCRFWLVCIL